MVTLQVSFVSVVVVVVGLLVRTSHSHSTQRSSILAWVVSPPPHNNRRFGRRRASTGRLSATNGLTPPPPDTLAAVMDFNSNFKKGLKFVLLPQSADGQGHVALQSYDSTTARQTASDMMSSLVVAAAEDSTSGTVAAAAASQQQQLLASLSDALGSVPSLTVASATYQVDPVVGKTLAELERQLSNPPSLQMPVPQGKGLAQPLSESLERALENLQRYQNQPSAVLPNYNTDVVKIRYGFEVKASVVEQLDRIPAFVTAYRAQITHEMNDHVWPTVAGNNAAVRHQLFANAETLQHATTDQFTALSVKLQQLSMTTTTTPSEWKVPEALQSLKLDEHGAWYAGAFWGFLLLAAYSNSNNSNNNNQSIKSNTSTSMSSSQQRMGGFRGNMNGAGAASMATTAAYVENYEKERLEGMVSELTKAVYALSTELRELRSEKAATDYALQAMQTQVMTVQSAIDNNNTNSNQKVNGNDNSLRAQLAASVAESQALQSQLDVARYEVATLLEVNEALAEGITALDVPSSRNFPHPPTTPPPKVERKKSQLFPQQNLYFFAN